MVNGGFANMLQWTEKIQAVLKDEGGGKKTQNHHLVSLI